MSRPWDDLLSGEELAYRVTEPPRTARLERLPADLDPRVAAALAAGGGLPGLGLLGEEALDAAGSKRSGEAGVELGREPLEPGRARRLGHPVRELLSREQVVPGAAHVPRYGANVRSNRLLLCAPMIVSRTSPPSNRITVGTERTP